MCVCASLSTGPRWLRNQQQDCGGEEGGEGGGECDEYQQVDQSTAGVTEPLPTSVCDTQGASGKGREEDMVSEILLLISQWNTCSSSLPRYKPSHYKETAVSRLLSTGVHVLFSQSQSHSASLLATLGSSEAVQGHTISLTEQHTQAVQPAVMKLLQCVPGMPYLTALSMATAFTSLKELLPW